MATEQPRPYAANELAAHPAMLRAYNPASRPTPFGFLDLPPEIRLHIYFHILPRGETIAVNGDIHLRTHPHQDWCRNFRDNHVFTLSIQIEQECLDVLYSQNTFQLKLSHVHCSNRWVRFPEPDLLRIRHLRLVDVDVTFFEAEKPRYHHQAWDSILSNLRTLKLAFRQPRPSLLPDRGLFTFIHDPARQGEVRMWREMMILWFELLVPWLDWFGEFVGAETVVIAEECCGDETRRLIKKYMPACQDCYASNY
ncbi:uncharacterized protein N7482_003390 [Penicillium canariense]|uniref:Uncharacterized protein n=1 Tax=Penicillium canariense TaxID=189055 RepID=A0A9W9I4K5_9EURO|nr:uncharacterized protein N7482_003390 [Penicillium canariense]KAJ5167796.1 hypothetical protein N7482_003390 [Penicillium canariense]